MCTVLNVDIPVIYIGVSVHIHVKYVIRHSVIRAVLLDINTFILSALMPVKFVIKHSVSKAFLYNTNAYILVSVLILVVCVIRHSVTGAN
jgi:hypothetical protein